MGRSSRNIFTQGISFEIFSKEYLVWDLELDTLTGSIKMSLGAHVGYTLGGSIGIFLGLALGNYFGTWELSLVGVSLVAPSGLMIGTREGYLVRL